MFCANAPGPFGTTVRQFGPDGVGAPGMLVGVAVGVGGNGVGVAVDGGAVGVSVGGITSVGVNVAQWPVPKHAALKTALQPVSHRPSAGAPQAETSTPHWQQSVKLFGVFVGVGVGVAVFVGVGVSVGVSVGVAVGVSVGVLVGVKVTVAVVVGVGVSVGVSVGVGVGVLVGVWVAVGVGVGVLVGVGVFVGVSVGVEVGVTVGVGVFVGVLVGVGVFVGVGVAVGVLVGVGVNVAQALPWQIAPSTSTQKPQFPAVWIVQKAPQSQQTNCARAGLAETHTSITAANMIPVVRRPTNRRSTKLLISTIATADGCLLRCVPRAWTFGPDRFVDLKQAL